MQTLRQSCEERNLDMIEDVANLKEYWQKRLVAECPAQTTPTRESIVLWLLGLDLNRLDSLNPKAFEITKQSIQYRWRILHQRYLGVGRERAYHNLISRLGGLITLRHKIQTWIALSRDRQRTVIDVLQEILQELLQSDTYIQQQIISIAEITTDRRLRDTLLLATVEEYCLRPVRNQPIILYRFVNYLRRTQRGGLTQVPTSELIRLVSEEVPTDDDDHRINLIDSQAIADYQEIQAQEEQLVLRQTVHEQLEKYLLSNLGTEAAEWLRLYLQGKSQEEIAKKLNKPIKEVYRLREKISYHAVRVFALKNQPDLVDNWLAISLQEHNFGLTPNQWQQLSAQLAPLGQEILKLRRAGNSIENTAQLLKLKTHQVLGEWTKIYLLAQSLRTEN